MDSLLQEFSKLPNEIYGINVLYNLKHREQMSVVFRELLQVQCDNCKCYVNKRSARNAEIFFMDFSFCSRKCYEACEYRITTHFRDLHGIHPWIID